MHWLPKVSRHRIVVCQAEPRRVARVAKQIEREIGSLLLTDKVILDVTRPAGNGSSLGDALCSCTGVELSNDLQVVKIYVSIYSDKQDVRQRMLTRLSGLAGYVRSQIGKRIRLRLTPEVRFVNDASIERGERVLELLNRAEKEKRGELAPLPIYVPGEDHSDSGLKDSDEDEDDGFFVLDDEQGSDEEDSAPTKKKANRFLEGVDDDEYDDQQAVGGFFTADMFPDAHPELEAIELKGKSAEWEAKKGWKGNKYKGRSGRKGGGSIKR